MPRANSSDEVQALKCETFKTSDEATSSKNKDENNRETALSEHIQTEQKNSFRSSNEKHNSRKSLSDVNREIPSIQPSSSVSKSRNPKVSAISFNKSDTT